MWHEPVTNDRSSHGLAACIVGPLRSFNRPEVWTSIRDNVLAPAAAEVDSADAFIMVKVDGSLADVSARVFLNNGRSSGRGTPGLMNNSWRDAIIEAEYAATRATARNLWVGYSQVGARRGAQLAFVDFDYRNLSPLMSACPENSNHAHKNQQKLVGMMSHDNVLCFEMVREQERRRGAKYALVARLRPDIQFCKPIPSLISLLQPGSRSGHKQHHLPHPQHHPHWHHHTTHHATPAPLLRPLQSALNYFAPRDAV